MALNIVGDDILEKIKKLIEAGQTVKDKLGDIEEGAEAAAALTAAIDHAREAGSDPIDVLWLFGDAIALVKKVAPTGMKEILSVYGDCISVVAGSLEKIALTPYDRAIDRAYSETLDVTEAIKLADRFLPDAPAADRTRGIDRVTLRHLRRSHLSDKGADLEASFRHSGGRDLIAQDAAGELGGLADLVAPGPAGAIRAGLFVAMAFVALTLAVDGCTGLRTYAQLDSGPVDYDVLVDGTLPPPPASEAPFVPWNFDNLRPPRIDFGPTVRQDAETTCSGGSGGGCNVGPTEPEPSLETGRCRPDDDEPCDHGDQPSCPGDEPHEVGHWDGLHHPMQDACRGIDPRHQPERSPETTPPGPPPTDGSKPAPEAEASHGTTPGAEPTTKPVGEGRPSGDPKPQPTPTPTPAPTPDPRNAIKGH